MIPAYLQDSVVKELKVLFTGFKLINSKNDVVDINIYPQHLPFRKKDDDKTPFPYILVCMEEGEILNENEDYNIKIYLVIGVHDSNENAQGDRDVVNIITTIYQHLFHKKILEKKYEIIYPFRWAIQDEDTFPKFMGGIETNWKLKIMQQEEDEYI